MAIGIGFTTEACMYKWYESFQSKCSCVCSHTILLEQPVLSHCIFLLPPKLSTELYQHLPCLGSFQQNVLTYIRTKFGLFWPVVPAISSICSLSSISNSIIYIPGRHYLIWRQAFHSIVYVAKVTQLLPCSKVCHPENRWPTDVQTCQT